jgi:hypothetical protein
MRAAEASFKAIRVLFGKNMHQVASTLVLPKRLAAVEAGQGIFLLRASLEENCLKPPLLPQRVGPFS